jgi:hypothetical protein
MQFFLHPALYFLSKNDSLCVSAIKKKKKLYALLLLFDNETNDIVPEIYSPSNL